MQVKTNDGNYDVASKGLGNTALGLGIAGLATSLLGGGASLFNLGRGNNGMAANPYVRSRYDVVCFELGNLDFALASASF